MPKVLHAAFRNNLASIRLGMSRDEISSRGPGKLCESFGHASTCSSKTGSQSEFRVAVSEELLHKMITAFPQGQIFDMSDRIEGNDYLSYGSAGEVSSAELNTLHEITCQLAKQIPEAESVLFFPLWDWNKSRWLAGTLLWTRSVERALSTEDLGFFKAFSNSVISEVARVGWDTTEKSKSDFIASISHELRSPLHGILGNIELLQATTVDPAQRDMINMIESCGMTLLDVMNHL